MSDIKIFIMFIPTKDWYWNDGDSDCWWHGEERRPFEIKEYEDFLNFLYCLKHPRFFKVSTVKNDDLLTEKELKEYIFYLKLKIPNV